MGRTKDSVTLLEDRYGRKPRATNPPTFPTEAPRDRVDVDMDFKGQAKLLDDIDLPRIGAEIGVGEDEIHAVLDVETRGGGFDNQGRPKMLFEPHIFYRQLGAGPKRDAAVAAGLARRSWKRDYPRDSYPRLQRAMQIDAAAALRSASWGLGQIMGFNHGLAGYGDVVSMVEDFKEDEENHLSAMVKFIASAGLDDELRSHDWAGFARGYNGSGYAANKYDTKLAAAFKKWQGIRDTPFVIDRTPEPIDVQLTAPRDEPTNFLAALFKAIFGGRK